jgi:hypothetical protein
MYFKNDGCFAVENPSSQRKVGSISDYDPMNDRWGSVTGQHGINTSAFWDICAWLLTLLTIKY